MNDEAVGKLCVGNAGAGGGVGGGGGVGSGGGESCRII